MMHAITPNKAKITAAMQVILEDRILEILVGGGGGSGYFFSMFYTCISGLF
ncbi:hypothetical protein SBV45_03180 [Chlamydia crocodili]|uniref:hypothetical protein n=1 Tax=Chlamydia TaxID=810 RepID=UPI0035D4639B